MPPVHLPSVTSIGSAALDDLGPVRLPLETHVPRLRGRILALGTDGAGSAGVWECSPGRWQRHIMEAEFSHWLSGHARFTPKGGAPFDIRGGDTVWFPRRSEGVWEIVETVRKVYIILEPDDLGFALNRSVRRLGRRLLRSFRGHRADLGRPANESPVWRSVEPAADPAPKKLEEVE